MASAIGGDDDLAAAARNGDGGALGELYARHADSVFAAAFRLTGTREDAEDVLQDVFVGLPEALRSYESRGKFGAWLRQVAVRTALMRLRSRERLREDDIASIPEVAVQQRAEVDRIAAREAIMALPPALRTVFMLKEVEGYSHGEIGALLGISPGASAARLFRAWDVLFGRSEAAEERETQ